MKCPKCPKCDGEMRPECNTQDSPLVCHLCTMFESQAPPLQGQNPSCWPMRPSIALAVHPDQVPEAIAHDKQRGLKGVTYLPNGQPIFADPGSHKAYLKAMGLHQRGRRKGALSCASTPTIGKLRREVEQRIAEYERGER